MSKRTLKICFALLASLNIIFLIGVFVAIVVGYQLKYPRIYLGFGWLPYILLVIAILLPLFQCLVGLLFISKDKFEENSRKFVRTNFLILIPAIVISLLAGGIIFAVPPLRSYTENKEHYLVLDDDLAEYKDVLLAFFPMDISNESHAFYRYSKRSTLFGNTVDISVEIRFSDSEFAIKKQQLEELGQLTNLNQNRYQIILYGIGYPYGVETFLEMDDERHSIKFIVMSR